MLTVLFPYRNNNVNTCDNLYVSSMLATVFPNYVCCTCHTKINSWLHSNITQTCCNNSDRSASCGARFASRNAQQYDSASAEIRTEHLPNASQKCRSFDELVLSHFTLLDFITATISSNEYKLWSTSLYSFFIHLSLPHSQTIITSSTLYSQAPISRAI